MLTVPTDVKVIEWPTSYMWFDAEGILYSVPKSGTQPVQSREEALVQLQEFKNLVNHKKTCMITITDSNAPPPKKEDRDWIAKELDEIVKAMAIISTSPLSRMAANLFFGLKPPAYPVKFFSNREDARKWIRQYL